MEKRSEKKLGKNSRRMFTPEEDLVIISMFGQQSNKNWNQIASLLKNRTARQVRERFKNYLSPGIKNGPWTREEDQLLRDLYQQYGSKWSKISNHFPSRSEINIKNRWTSISKVIPVKIEKNIDEKENIQHLEELDSTGFDAFQYDSDPQMDIFDLQFQI